MTLLVTLALQLGGALIWATQLDARVNNLEQQTAGISGFSEKFARIEERLQGMKEDMETIKHGLGRLTERLLK